MQQSGKSAWILSLDGRWCRCEVKHIGGPLSIFNANDGIKGGMSGSPILNDAGEAIGIVCISAGVMGSTMPREGGPNPRLFHDLPRWLPSDPAEVVSLPKRRARA